MDRFTLLGKSETKQLMFRLAAIVAALVLTTISVIFVQNSDNHELFPSHAPQELVVKQISAINRRDISELIPAITPISEKKSKPELFPAQTPPRTTKLEWQQGWQHNGWQLDDGDWPDEGGEFSEGQTFPGDPATFKVHQVYGYIPVYDGMTKAEADEYWSELQKKYFRHNPSRTTYPAVPVVFGEDSNGGHPLTSRLPRPTSEIYVNDNNNPWRHHPLPMTPTGSIQHLVVGRAGDVMERKFKSKSKAAHESNKLIEKLAEVESHPQQEEKSAEKVSVESSGEHSIASLQQSPVSEDWKAVIFMQSQLYEMQKRLALEEEDNQELSNQLKVLKAKVASKVTVKSRDVKPASELSEISQLKEVISGIQKRQEVVEQENARLKQQLSAIENLTIKKKALNSAAKTVLASQRSQTNVNRKASKVSNPAVNNVSPKFSRQFVSTQPKSDNVGATAKSHASAATTQGKVSSAPAFEKPSLKSANSDGGMPSTLVKAAAAVAATKLAKTDLAKHSLLIPPHHATAVGTKTAVQHNAAAAAAAPTASEKVKAVAKPAAANAGGGSGTALAFHAASAAAKDMVVRELAQDEESSVESEADAIFGPGPAVDELGDSGQGQGFDRLHSLERNALGSGAPPRR